MTFLLESFSGFTVLGGSKAPPKKVLGRGLTQLVERRGDSSGWLVFWKLAKVIAATGDPKRPTLDS
jgi:hypothetical protein